MGGAEVSEANGVLRNHYHPPGATIYIEKRLTNQSYRLFSQPLSIILVIVVMIMDHIARSVIGQELALVLSCEGLEE